MLHALAVAHFTNGTPCWAVAIVPALVLAVVASSWFAANAATTNREDDQ